MVQHLKHESPEDPLAALEHEVLAEVRTPLKVQEEKKGILATIRSVSSSITHKLFLARLPSGLDEERYFFIKTMYDRLRISAGRGELLTNPKWVRFVKQAVASSETSISASMRADFNVLDFVLQEYLPDELVHDERRYREARTFFIDELGLLPALA